MDNKRLSIYRNMYAFGDDRSPRFANAGAGDFINNVVAGFRTPTEIFNKTSQHGDPDYGWQVNLINNYWDSFNAAATPSVLVSQPHPQTLIHAAGNYNPDYVPSGAAGDQIDIFTGDSPAPFLRSSPVAVGAPPIPYDVMTYSAAKNEVVNKAGASTATTASRKPRGRGVGNTCATAISKCSSISDATSASGKI
ncbi:MAG: hypothetical protein ACREEM_49315 [Blastocatellia bacterium]